MRPTTISIAPENFRASRSIISASSIPQQRQRQPRGWPRLQHLPPESEQLRRSSSGIRVHSTRPLYQCRSAQSARGSLRPERNRSSARLCQPAPLARSAATTSGDSLMSIFCLRAYGLSAGWPRGRTSKATASGGKTSSARRARANISSVHSGLWSSKTTVSFSIIATHLLLVQTRRLDSRNGDPFARFAAAAPSWPSLLALIPSVTTISQSLISPERRSSDSTLRAAECSGSLS